jgi:hypothetical protein
VNVLCTAGSAGVLATCGQTGGKVSATRTSFQGDTVTGGMNRRFFTGGAANGIPGEPRQSFNSASITVQEKIIVPIKRSKGVIVFE